MVFLTLQAAFPKKQLTWRWWCTGRKLCRILVNKTRKQDCAKGKVGATKSWHFSWSHRDQLILRVFVCFYVCFNFLHFRSWDWIFMSHINHFAFKLGLLPEKEHYFDMILCESILFCWEWFSKKTQFGFLRVRRVGVQTWGWPGLPITTTHCMFRKEQLHTFSTTKHIHFQIMMLVVLSKVVSYYS